MRDYNITTPTDFDKVIKELMLDNDCTTAQGFGNACNNCPYSNNCAEDDLYFVCECYQESLA